MNLNSFLSILIMTFALNSPLAHSMQNTELQSVSTSGQCLRKSDPDRGEVYIGVRTLEKTASVATQKATAVYEKFREMIKKMNLKDAELATTSLSVNEEKEWVNNSNVFKGYRAVMGLTVSTSEIDKLGKAIAQASGIGANDIQSLQLSLSTEKTMIEQRACLEAALRDAKLKAETLAKAGGRKLGSVLQIQEGGGHSERPQRIYADKRASFSADMSEEKSANIETKPLEVQVSVNAIFELK